MTSAIKCPHCSQKVNLPSSLSELVITCPMCKKSFESPIIPNDAAAPPTIPKDTLQPASDFVQEKPAQPKAELFPNPNFVGNESGDLASKFGCGCLIVGVIALAIGIVVLTQYLMTAR